MRLNIPAQCHVLGVWNDSVTGPFHNRSRVISISIWLDAIYCGLFFFIRFERMCHLGSQAAQRSLKQLPIFSLRTINVLRLSAAFIVFDLSKRDLFLSECCSQLPVRSNIRASPEAKIQDACNVRGLN